MKAVIKEKMCFSISASLCFFFLCYLIVLTVESVTELKQYCTKTKHDALVQ